MGWRQQRHWAQLEQLGILGGSRFTVIDLLSSDKGIAAQ